MLIVAGIIISLGDVRFLREPDAVSDLFYVPHDLPCKHVMRGRESQEVSAPITGQSHSLL